TPWGRIFGFHLDIKRTDIVYLFN
ncbi:hypothetical protein, partial [Plasmodium yoelii yoelii]